MTNPSLLILPGDGIGPEVMAEVRKVIGWYGTKRDLAFDVSEDLVGGCAYRAGRRILQLGVAAQPGYSAGA